MLVDLHLIFQWMCTFLRVCMTSSSPAIFIISFKEEKTGSGMCVHRNWKANSGLLGSVVVLLNYNGKKR